MMQDQDHSMSIFKGYHSKFLSVGFTYIFCSVFALFYFSVLDG
jgi:hypothetical protein